MIKKLLALVVVVVMAVPAFAANPTAEGKFVVSMPMLSYGSLGGDLYENAEGDSETIIAVGAGQYQIGVEYFIVNSIAIGGAFEYLQEDTAEITTMSITPMVTYYHAMDLLIPYAGIGYGYTSIENDATGAEATGTSIMVKLGGAYMLGENLSVFGELVYSMDEVEANDVTVDGTTMGLNVGIKAFF